MIHAGEHACLVVGERRQQHDRVAAYFVEGLADGERAIYVARDDAVRAVLRGLEERGVATAREGARGALVLLDAASVYHCEGAFEPQRLLDTVADAVARALEDGFAGVRIAGETPGVVPAAAVPAVLEYESGLDRYLPARAATALCVYERDTWPGNALDRLVRAHPMLLMRDDSCRANPSYAPRHAARVLVVEVADDDADSLSMLLEMMGHSVRRECDGASALSAARAARPDVMLVAIDLTSDMSGYDLALAVRREPSLAATRLVALTVYGSAQDRERAFASGFDVHLLKPVSPDTLRAVLARPDRKR